MTGIQPAYADDEGTRRDDALSNACNAEYTSRPDTGPVEGTSPLGRPCVAQPERWWPNAGEDPVAS
ncbi:hypothetical protein, partial [Actinoplanes sp. M2I2]|uniref:hypothetical protein n=1 Tax=Actinoplanes sp. M2I2 TaxID=1734444 RepID=UPI002021047D